MLVHQHLVHRMKKWNNSTMILKEQWLSVTPNLKSLQGISMQTLELNKGFFKTMEALEIVERNERGDRLLNCRGTQTDHGKYTVSEAIK